MGFKLHQDVEINGYQVEYFIPDLNIVIETLKRTDLYPGSKSLQNYNMFRRTIITKSHAINSGPEYKIVYLL